MSGMKLGWGTRIAVLYGGFVILIAALVIGSTLQSFDLVAPDYYEQEVKYQEVIDASKNQSGLSAPVKIETTASDVVINFPPEFLDKSITGTAQFYSPVNSAWDKEITITTTKNTVTISRSALGKVAYKLKLAWLAGGKKYYQVSDINLR